MCAETLYTRQQQQTELFFQTNKVSPHLCGAAQLNKTKNQISVALEILSERYCLCRFQPDA